MRNLSPSNFVAKINSHKILDKAQFANIYFREILGKAQFAKINSREMSEKVAFSLGLMTIRFCWDKKT